MSLKQILKTITIVLPLIDAVRGIWRKKSAKRILEESEVPQKIDTSRDAEIDRKLRQKDPR